MRRVDPKWAARYAARLHPEASIRASSTQFFYLVDSGHERCTRVIFNVIDTADERFTLLKPEQIPLARRLEALESDFDALKDPKGRWIRRQILEPHEIDFIERFERRGERVQWIPKDDSPEHIPTNDFVWLTNGILASELKSSGGRYATIALQIGKSVKKAQKRGVRKEVFIIDRGEYGLPAKLAQQLSLYNVRNPENKIRRLFVMYQEGTRFTEVPLQ